jgi:thioredoxin 1
MQTLADFSRIERPSVIECWAAWCSPCRQMRPAIDKAAAKYSAQVNLLSLDVEENPDMARTLGVRSIPTLIVMRQGNEIARRTGIQSPEQVEALFGAALSGSALMPGSLPAGRRLWRLLAGGGLILAGWLGHPSALLIGLGVALAFTGVYDRCPIWRALTLARRNRGG